MNETKHTLAARWVFPVAGPPLEHGLVTVHGERIASIDAHGTSTPDVDLGNVAIVPGFVNAHTHLDLSGLRGKCPPRPDFTEWLRVVIQHRRQVALEQISADIETGLKECIGAGTTLVGDIAAEGQSWASFTNGPIRAVVYREIIGLGNRQALQAFAEAHAWLREHDDTLTCKRGLSPHAPYSVNHGLFANAADYCSRLAIHLAETRDELELLSHRSGAFVPFLKELGVWHPDALSPSVGAIVRRTQRARCVYAHCNYLPLDSQISPLGSIVYCPRTHAAFGHPPHPFREFLARGVRVALGTDSLASNPDLSILNEARFVHARYPDFSMPQLLRMATLSGAEALGWADECGSLEPGKSADLAVVALPEQEASDPHQLLFESTLPVERVMVRGEWVYPAGANATGLANSP